MAQKEIRTWRVFSTPGQPGVHVWFDPRTEILTLRDLTEVEKSVTLDKRRSVSGLIRSDQAEDIDGCEQGHQDFPGDPSFVQFVLFDEEV